MPIDPFRLRPFLRTTLDSTDFAHLGRKYEGKVRDVYMPNDRERILIATDRQSAFDKMWTTIPLKGQVLTQISGWWFDQIKDVMPTHVLSLPDPNVMVAKNLQMLRVELVVRGYLTGSTSTSAWVNYKNGVRDLCGNVLPDGMVKNQQFDHPIITPTTKAAEDEPIDATDIVARGLATEAQWEEIKEKSLAVFKKGQEIAAKRGLILVDTKYEMGFDANGVVTMADEMHTPDSSRYWMAATYQERFSAGMEPESLDKEFFRLWLRGAGFDPARPEKTLPAITDEVRVVLAAKYVDLYEKITGHTFEVPSDLDVSARIERSLQTHMKH